MIKTEAELISIFQNLNLGVRNLSRRFTNVSLGEKKYE